MWEAGPRRDTLRSRALAAMLFHVTEKVKTTLRRVTLDVQLQSKLQNQFNQLVPGYHIVVIGIELLEYIAAKI